MVARLKHGHLLLPLVLFFALLHGGLYASFMPPWGLIDEEQHLHYVQSLAERQAIPIVGITALSPEIIESAFATRRWEHFHWPTPSSLALSDLGLEGFSYEGYQPPLYYLVLAPFFALLDGDILERLYALRWLSLALSLLTLIMVFSIGRRLFPDEPAVSYFACIFLALLPERTFAVSRVNNDVGLEVAATAVIWACTVAVLDGMSLRRGVLIGVLFGVSFLIKASVAVLLVPVAFAFWANRRSVGLLKNAAYSAGIIALFVVPWTIRNMLVYGDPTGFSSFQKITNFAAPALTMSRIGTAMWDTFRHLWLVWWKGAKAADNTIITVLALALLVACAEAGMRLWYAVRSRWLSERQTQVVLMYVASVLVCGVAILASYFAGAVPVIQGRFFLPVIASLSILLAYGLWHSAPRAFWGGGILLLLLFASVGGLFGNLLPFHYYWSAFTAYAHQPVPVEVSLGIGDRWQLFLGRLLADKPAFILSLLPWLLIAFPVALAAAGAIWARLARLEPGNRYLRES